MEKFDLCVIGAGPSGYAAAMRGIDFGKKVALIEKNKIGGAGIFNGALSSKTLWEISESYKVTRIKDQGFTVQNSTLNFLKVLGEMQLAVNERYSQLTEQIEYYQKKGKITLLNGHGRLQNKNEIIVSSNGIEETIWADNTILAIGSRPRKLPHIPIDENIIVTSDGVANFKDFPESIVILGAGVIGCEFATIFSNFGKTKVFLIDKESRILPFEDEDISLALAGNLENNGVTIHKGSSLDSMQIVDGKVQYSLLYNDGRKEIHTVEKALISIGRVANAENLGLENVGFELNDRGYAVDDKTQSNIPNIYAVGDFTADIALVNVGELEGRYAVERIFSSPKRDLVYENISTIMFLNPEVASVGLNETQAKKKKIPYRLAVMNYRYVNRAIAMRKLDGFFKIIVTDDEDMKILGMRAMGNHASSTIEVIALMISMNIGIEYLAELIHPHPSIPEGLQECARMLMGKSIIKPEVFSQHLRCYRVSSEGINSELTF